MRPLSSTTTRDSKSISFMTDFRIFHQKSSLC